MNREQLMAVLIAPHVTENVSPFSSARALNRSAKPSSCGLRSKG